MGADGIVETYKVSAWETNDDESMTLNGTCYDATNEDGGSNALSSIAMDYKERWEVVNDADVTIATKEEVDAGIGGTPLVQ